ncbi:MAG: excinuclease ABC subunit UvrC [Microscillaceae bacterium]
MISDETLKESVRNLPHLPGIYRFYDHEDTLLYVGKAKDLKNRVSSYFNQSRQHSRKTLKMVAQIAVLRFTLVNSEHEALLLENTLIKTHQPKYNILLKDDKTYPFLCLTHEAFPRLFVSRHPEYKEGTYYGPYSKLAAMHTVRELLHELYPIRTCTLPLQPQSIAQGKFKVCLEYHIGNCKGPCEGHQSQSSYQHEIEQAAHILKGNLGPAKQYFREKMQAHAEALEFEKAQEYKIKLERLEEYQSRSLVVNPKLEEMDVFALISDEKSAYVNYLRIKDGAVIHSQNVQIQKKLEEAEEAILSLVIFDLRQSQQSQAQEIISNLNPEALPENTLLSIPKIGDKKKLLDLSLKNVLYFKQEKNRVKQEKNPQEPVKAVLELQKALQLAQPPMHIECFDNSNIQGTNPVAAMVFFKNGKPLKKEYRHFNIKTVEGPNDFASMYEIVGRRYRRLQEENKAFPELIIIDGGKGQLSSACQALKDLGVYGQIPIIGIAKRLEEIYFPEDEVPLHIHKKSLALKLIQQVRDEAHRFAIEFHRLKRSKSSLQNELESIPGIGKTLTEKLLRHFKSLKKIREASPEALAEVIGKAKATLVLAGLTKKEEH